MKDLGLDSLDQVEIIMAMEDEFGNAGCAWGPHAAMLGLRGPSDGGARWDLNQTLPVEAVAVAHTRGRTHAHSSPPTWFPVCPLCTLLATHTGTATCAKETFQGSPTHSVGAKGPRCRTQSVPRRSGDCRDGTVRAGGHRALPQ